MKFSRDNRRVLLGQSGRGGRNECPKAFLPHPPLPLSLSPFSTRFVPGKSRKRFLPRQSFFSPSFPLLFSYTVEEEGNKKFFLLPPSSFVRGTKEDREERRKSKDEEIPFPSSCVPLFPPPPLFVCRLRIWQSRRGFRASATQREIPLERGKNSSQSPSKSQGGRNKFLVKKKLRGLGMPSRSYSIMPTGYKSRMFDSN